MLEMSQHRELRPLGPDTGSEQACLAPYTEPSCSNLLFDFKGAPVFFSVVYRGPQPRSVTKGMIAKTKPPFCNRGARREGASCHSQRMHREGPRQSRKQSELTKAKTDKTK
jgi:hypothetical protein